jgi:hypothetical protein
VTAGLATILVALVVAIGIEVLWLQPTDVQCWRSKGLVRTRQPFDDHLLALRWVSEHRAPNEVSSPQFPGGTEAQLFGGGRVQMLFGTIRPDTGELVASFEVGFSSDVPSQVRWRTFVDNACAILPSATPSAVRWQLEELLAHVDRLDGPSAYNALSAERRLIEIPLTDTTLRWERVPGWSDAHRRLRVGSAIACVVALVLVSVFCWKLR